MRGKVVKTTGVKQPKKSLLKATNLQNFRGFYESGISRHRLNLLKYFLSLLDSFSKERSFFQ